MKVRDFHDSASNRSVDGQRYYYSTYYYLNKISIKLFTIAKSKHPKPTMQ
jgi:hypothetical protein